MVFPVMMIPVPCLSWAIFNMIGFYPDCPGDPYYTLTTPVFDKVVIRLDSDTWGSDKLDDRNWAPFNRVLIHS